MRMKNITVFIEVNSKPQNRALTLIHSITVAEMFHLCLHHFLIRKLRKVNDHEKKSTWPKGVSHQMCYVQGINIYSNKFQKEVSSFTNLLMWIYSQCILFINKCAAY